MQEQYQRQYYLFENGKIPALIFRDQTSNLKSDLENLALIKRMEIKRSGKNPEDFCIKEYVLTNEYIVKDVIKTDL